MQRDRKGRRARARPERASLILSLQDLCDRIDLAGREARRRFWWSLAIIILGPPLLIPPAFATLGMWIVMLNLVLVVLSWQWWTEARSEVRT